MVTEKDLNPELIEILSEQHKNIVIDFINSFLTTFKECITREEILTRINRLEYIGFERQENIGERCGSADAKFISSSQKIIISNRHKTSENNIIKSLLYHELIHAISYHKEKDLDSCNNRIVFSTLDMEYDRNAGKIKAVTKGKEISELSLSELLRDD